MSNSKLVTYTKVSPNRDTPRNHKIDTITIHCIVGQWTAKQGCDFFRNLQFRHLQTMLWARMEALVFLFLKVTEVGVLPVHPMTTGQSPLKLHLTQNILMQ